MYGYLVTGQDLDKVHPELAGNVCQNGVTVANVNGKPCIRQRINYDALDLDYVVFCKFVNLPGFYFAFRGLKKPALSVIRC